MQVSYEDYGTVDEVAVTQIRQHTVVEDKSGKKAKSAEEAKKRKEKVEKKKQRFKEQEEALTQEKNKWQVCAHIANLLKPSLAWNHNACSWICTRAKSLLAPIVVFSGVSDACILHPTELQHQDYQEDKEEGEHVCDIRVWQGRRGRVRKGDDRIPPEGEVHQVQVRDASLGVVPT